MIANHLKDYMPYIIFQYMSYNMFINQTFRLIIKLHLDNYYIIIKEHSNDTLSIQR